MRLLIIAYFPILRHLVEQWSTDEDVSHGFFVPPVAAFIAWQRRDRILALDYHPAWWGLGVMAWAALQGYVGTLGAELFLQRTSFLIALVGLLLVMGGTRLVRELAFPLLLLPFMIPIPAVLYNQITFPLQLFASQVAEFSSRSDGNPGAARRQHFGAGEPEAFRGRSMQRNSQSAFAFFPLAGVRLLFRQESVDALGSDWPRRSRLRFWRIPAALPSPAC